MFLLIDTSATQALIALADEQKIIDCHAWSAGRSLSGDLLPQIDKLLRKHKQTGAQLAGLGILTGPGSYTGLRLGVATVNALGLAWQIPVCGVSRFAAWQNFYSKNKIRQPLIVLDADHDNIFLQLNKQTEDWTGAPEEQATMLKKAKNIYTDVPAAILTRLKKIAKLARIHKVSRETADLAESMRLAVLQQGFLPTFKSVRPLYLRPPVITPAKNAKPF